MHTCTETTIREVIARHGGVLKSGVQSPEDGQCCVLEARSLCLGMEMTDDPSLVGMPDIRPLNDAGWSSDEKRTEAMIRLCVAYADWSRWTYAQRSRVMSRVAIQTVRRIIGELLVLPEKVREKCRKAEDLDAAAGAAGDAEAAGYAAAGDAGYAAARAARDAEDAARDSVIETAVDIWIEAAAFSEPT